MILTANPCELFAMNPRFPPRNPGNFYREIVEFALFRDSVNFELFREQLFGNLWLAGGWYYLRRQKTRGIYAIFATIPRGNIPSGGAEFLHPNRQGSR